MQTVFIVQHEYERDGIDHSFLIGAYRSLAEAEAAVGRIRLKPGFRDWPDGFTIDEYTLGEDNWTEGFVSVANINVPIGEEGKFVTVEAEWRPDNLYEIFLTDGDGDTANWKYKPGDVVRCELQTINHVPKCLVAVALAKKPSN